MHEDDGNTFYYHTETKESSWDHPSDAIYRQLKVEMNRNFGKNYPRSQVSYTAGLHEKDLSLLL